MNKRPTGFGGVMPRFPWYVGLLLLLASPLAGQNLVTNGSFNNDDANWADPVPGNGTFVHDPTLDVNSSPASGSGLMTNTISSVVFGTISARQCVAVTAGQQYYWGGSIRFPVSETTTGSTSVNVLFFSMASCVGGSEISGTTGTVRDPLIGDARGVWHTSNFGSIAGGFTAPVGSLSVQVILSMTKNEMAGTRSANFDGIFFAQV